MTDEMRTETEGARTTRRRLLAGAAGAALGLLVGDRLTSREQQVQARPSPAPAASPPETAKPTQTAQPTPTESPTPSPTPELKLGELPDILSSKDKDWERYFAKEENLEKINQMIKQQQEEENIKAKAENREAALVGLFIPKNFVEALKNKEWEIRKIVSRQGSVNYAFSLPPSTELNTPIEGGMEQAGFSGGGRSLEIRNPQFQFWALYFGDAGFSPRGNLIAGEHYLTINNETQLFRRFGINDMKEETRIFAAAKKSSNPTGPFISIKWLTNDKGQIIYH